MTLTDLRFVPILFVLIWASGCAGRSAPEADPADSAAATAEPEQALPAVPTAPLVPTTQHDRLWVPPLFTTEVDEVHYYISRLADRRFIDVHGGREHPRVWYIAAERLGQIGEPAVPMLFALIDTRDEYELMLVLYALQMATQDPQLKAQTGGDYIRLTEALNQDANAENRAIALEWWEQHGWRWQ